MRINASKQMSQVAWAYVIFLLISKTASFALTLLVSSISALTGGHIDLSFLFYNKDISMLISQLIMYGIAFPVFALYMHKIPSWTKKDTKTIPLNQFFVLLIFCYGMTYIGNLIGQFLMANAGAFSGTAPENPLDTVVMDMHPGMVFLTTVIIAPIMEELIFRKYLIDRLVPFGQKYAVVLSGLSFGLFHGNCFQFFYAFLVGMIFAYVYSCTGRVRYNIALHMCINLLGGVLPLMITNGMDAGYLLSFLLSMLLSGVTLACAIITVVLSILYIRKLYWFPAWIFSGEPMSQLLLRIPSVWIFLVLTGFDFILSWFNGS